MAISEDWYPGTIAGEREMFEAIAMNLVQVNKTLLMDADKADRLMLMAQTYLVYSDNVALNRAAVKGLGTDFSTVMHGKRGIDPMPTAPKYHDLAIPAGDFVGMEAETREIRRYMTGLFTWTDGMGDVLKMNGTHSESKNPDTMSPVLKIKSVAGDKVFTSVKKDGMDGVEYQYRIAGAEVWQPLMSSGESETTLTIPVAAGTAQKIEIRAVYLQKFKRVGSWSPTYNAAVGG